MIKRIGFILLVCLAIGWAISKGARPAVELDHSIPLWGYQLRFGLLVEVTEVAEPSEAAEFAPREALLLPGDTASSQATAAAGELP